MSAVNPFAAMLPLKIVGSHYGENLDRLRILLDSFERFLDLPAPLHLFVVCVPGEMAAARAGLPQNRTRVLVEFVAEDDIVPGIGAHRAIGWFKQQALKLAFAARCPAPFCLTLDPDVLLCRRLRAGHLVADGRCFTSWMTKAEHPHWWEASAGLLGTLPDPARPGLNVTPNMLSTDVAVRLRAALAARLGAADPWLPLLDTDARWTEYTLYSVFAEASGLLDTYHRTDLPAGRRLLGRSVWTPENIGNYSLAAIHDDPEGAFFTVCASHAGLSATAVRALYDAMIDRPERRAA